LHRQHVSPTFPRVNTHLSPLIRRQQHIQWKRPIILSNPNIVSISPFVLCAHSKGRPAHTFRRFDPYSYPHRFGQTI
jgi:hypothetical protein